MDTIETETKAWSRCSTCERFRSNLDEDGNCAVCQAGIPVAPITLAYPGGMGEPIAVRIDGVETELTVPEPEPLDEAVLEDLADMKLIVEKPRRWWQFRRRRD